MKKLFKFTVIAFACVLTFTACSNDEADQIIDNASEAQTRVSSYDELANLEGKWVYFVLPRGIITNESEYYFSARHNATNTILSHIDDGSGRQQFLIKRTSLDGTYYTIDLRDGAKSGGHHFSVHNEDALRFDNESNRTLWSIIPVPNTSKYRIAYRKINGQMIYLHGWKFGSAHLRFDSEINILGEWEIKPI